jgi:CheY-like chemotaxis protein
VKFTPAGGRVLAAIDRVDSQIRVTITDTGVGIPAEALPNVFDMFAQVDALDRRAEQGLGIGLTLAKRLVDMHEGTIAASSEGAGCGSCFEVRLPILARGAAAAAAEAQSTTRLGRGTRVLVVDDNQDAADTLTTLLRMLEADVRVVYDGKSALELLDTFRPGIVVLDLGMPIMDGYTVARHIRERPDGAAIKLVALSGWGQAQDRERTAAAGFDRHLVKPVGFDEVQAVLAEAVPAPL